ncbi:hypothetical protein LXL04_019295 [Taraxacum kok-saghyz]
MTTKRSLTFTCKKFFTNIFKFKLKKPISIRRSLRKTKPTTTSTNKQRFSCLTTCFRSSRKSKNMDRLMDLKSFSDGGYMQKAPCSSPLTPAYIRMSKVNRENVVQEEDDAGEACRNFESYLVKMIAEEGKMRDLVDVEELLYCWKNLKSPVFMNLVCRFYGELCKDLFSSSGDVADHDDDIRRLM